jgi:hypothetical protein
MDQGRRSIVEHTTGWQALPQRGQAQWKENDTRVNGNFLATNERPARAWILSRREQKPG